MIMETPKQPSRLRRLRGPFLFLFGWGILVIVTSIVPVRTGLSYPLYVHEPGARGDAAYVMADGYAYWKRLRTASDLYRERRVPKIYLLNERQIFGYNFDIKRLETQTERAIRFLVWHGVPESAIELVTVRGDTTFGSLSEAQAFAELELPQVKRVVVVTSAPHTRRSKLCFRRCLPDDVSVQSFAASKLSSSTELYEPIWMEYLKLAVYYFVA